VVTISGPRTKGQKAKPIRYAAKFVITSGKGDKKKVETGLLVVKRASVRHPKRLTA
jgi:hypothetical protein